MMFVSGKRRPAFSLASAYAEHSRRHARSCNRALYEIGQKNAKGVDDKIKYY